MNKGLRDLVKRICKSSKFSLFWDEEKFGEAPRPALGASYLLVGQDKLTCSNIDVYVFECKLLGIKEWVCLSVDDRNILEDRYVLVRNFNRESVKKNFENLLKEYGVFETVDFNKALAFVEESLRKKFRGVGVKTFILGGKSDEEYESDTFREGDLLC